MAIKEFFEKANTPGDIAAIAVGYAVGFAVDVFLFPGGVLPGTVAGVSAVGCLGLKKAADALFFKVKNEKTRETRPINLERRANALLDFLEHRVEQTGLENHNREILKNLKRSLKQQIELWEGGVLEEEEFREQVSEIRLTCIENIFALKDTADKDKYIRQ